jgi:hypothetical protein
MKIGWATPLHHRSAVGRFSVGVAAALAGQGMRVDLLRTERLPVAAEPRLPSALKIRDVARMGDFSQLADYDLLVYNFGDDASLHERAVDALMRRPGLCIFHDVDFRALFREWTAARDCPQAAPSPTDRLPCRDADSRHLNGSEASRDPSNNPLTLESLAGHALAAVAHEGDVLRRLQRCGPGPVRHIPVPSRQAGTTTAPAAASSFDAYAEALLPLMRVALEAEPLMRLSAQLGRELASLGASPDGPEALRIAQMATDLFSPGDALSNERPDRGRAADFRFLPAIRAAMANDSPPLPLRSRKRKRSRLRRMARKIAQHVMQVVQVMRSRPASVPARGDPSSRRGTEGSRR